MNGNMRHSNVKLVTHEDIYIKEVNWRINYQVAKGMSDNWEMFSVAIAPISFTKQTYGRYIIYVSDNMFNIIKGFLDSYQITTVKTVADVFEYLKKNNVKQNGTFKETLTRCLNAIVNKRESLKKEEE